VRGIAGVDDRRGAGFRLADLMLSHNVLLACRPASWYNSCAERRFALFWSVLSAPGVRYRRGSFVKEIGLRMLFRSPHKAEAFLSAFIIGLREWFRQLLPDFLNQLYKNRSLMLTYPHCVDKWLDSIYNIYVDS
jgi:hypothetical protein